MYLHGQESFEIIILRFSENAQRPGFITVYIVEIIIFYGGGTRVKSTFIYIYILFNTFICEYEYRIFRKKILRLYGFFFLFYFCTNAGLLKLYK